ncbi:MAG: adaptor protein MecA [Lachnospiraceae bacterium]|nr:adaptor protein MecA [Lachnospiraceae bacterium]
MKIEKINDNQIRCTLNKQDLAARQIKLSELAYGTEKAKNLFRDMMQMASHEYGFEVDDQPIMIEAIPLSSESIVLNISKVSNPDELDTRFSRFSPTPDEFDMEMGDGFEDAEDIMADNASADDILGYYEEQEEGSNDAADNSIIDNDFISLGEILSSKIAERLAKKHRKEEKEVEAEQTLMLIFAFDKLATVEKVAKVLDGVYNGVNTLYKDAKKNKFYLVLAKSKHTPQEFNKVGNILAEYGDREMSSHSREAYLREHLTVMIKNDALQVLSSI